MSSGAPQQIGFVDASQTWRASRCGIHHPEQSGWQVDLNPVRVSAFIGGYAHHRVYRKRRVGKTSIAAANAVRAAELGHRTLILSTDLAHSFADSLDLPLGPEPTAVA